MKFVIEGLGISTYGAKEVALGILRRLANYPQHHFTLVFPDIPEFAAIAAPNISPALMPRPRNLLRREFLLNWYLPRLCRERQADALLCLGNFFPHRLPCPTAVLLQLPQVVYRGPEIDKRFTCREKLVAAYGRRLYRHVPEDLLIIVQIEAVKQRLMSLYGIDGAKIVVIPSAMPPFDTDQGAAQGLPAGESFQFLCFGRYYSHKNVEILFDALRQLPRYTAKPARCVITISAQDEPGARELVRKVSQAGESSKIVCVDPVSHERMPELYRSGNAYILPSLIESFSFTYDEAMYFGLPILTSDRDFAHERCGDAAIYFDPLDADSVAQAMARVMEEPELRRRLVENGQNRLAHALAWDEIAARFIDTLERVAGT
jgi:glycosyltransferase involved in cell wall biosynthesis